MDKYQCFFPVPYYVWPLSLLHFQRNPDDFFWLLEHGDEIPAVQVRSQQLTAAKLPSPEATEGEEDSYTDDQLPDIK